MRNINPELWGPSGWNFIHYAALGLEQSRLPSFRMFLDVLPDMLPCENCRSHARNYLSSHQVATASDAFGFTVDFHNAVNSRLGKPTMDAIRAKELLFNPHGKGRLGITTSIVIGIIFLIAVILFLIYLMKPK